MEGASSCSGQDNQRQTPYQSIEPELKGASDRDNASLGAQLEGSRVLREEYLLEEYMLALLSLCKKFAHDHY